MLCACSGEGMGLDIAVCAPYISEDRMDDCVDGAWRSCCFDSRLFPLTGENACGSLGVVPHFGVCL